MGLSLKVTSGEISALSGLDVASQRADDPRLIQLSAAVQGGNSGGPVMDEQGRAVAIVISKLEMTSDDEIAQNVNYGLKIAYVRPLLDGLKDLGNVGLDKAADSEVNAVANDQGAVFLVVARHPSTQ
jgi:S1-C subfamily serine protease